MVPAKVFQDSRASKLSRNSRSLIKPSKDRKSTMKAKVSLDEALILDFSHPDKEETSLVSTRALHSQALVTINPDQLDLLLSALLLFNPEIL